MIGEIGNVAGTISDINEKENKTSPRIVIGDILLGTNQMSGSKKRKLEVTEESEKNNRIDDEIVRILIPRENQNIQIKSGSIVPISKKVPTVNGPRIAVVQTFNRGDALPDRLWSCKERDICIEFGKGEKILAHECLLPDNLKAKMNFGIFRQTLLIPCDREVCLSVLNYFYGIHVSLSHWLENLQAVHFAREREIKGMEAFYWKEFITKNIKSETVLKILNQVEELILLDRESQETQRLYYDVKRCCYHYLGDLPDEDFCDIKNKHIRRFTNVFLDNVAEERKTKPSISDLIEDLIKPREFLKETLKKLSLIEWEGERGGDVLLFSNDGEEFVVHSLLLNTCINKHRCKDYTCVDHTSKSIFNNPILIGKTQFNDKSKKLNLGMSRGAVRDLINYIYDQTDEIKWDKESGPRIKELISFAKQYKWEEFYIWLKENVSVL